LFWGILILTGILASGILRIKLQDDWVKYFSKRFEVRRAVDFMEENLTGFNSIEYSLVSGEMNGINKPEYLKKIDEFAIWYRKQPNVVNVQTIANAIKRLNKNNEKRDKSTNK